MYVHLNSTLQTLHYKWGGGGPPQVIILDTASSGVLDQSDDENCMRRVSLDWTEALKTAVPRFWEDLKFRDKDSFEGMLLQSSSLQSHTALRLLQLYPKINCQRASRVDTVGLRGGQLNEFSIVLWKVGVDSLGILVALDFTCSFTWLLMSFVENKRIFKVRTLFSATLLYLYELQLAISCSH